MKRHPARVYRAIIKALVGLLLFALFRFITNLSPPELPKENGVAELYSNQTHHDLKDLYLSSIAHAQDSVLLIIYSLRDKDVIKALRAKAETGVPVTVICDKEASKGVAKNLSKTVKTHYRKGPGLMHQKILVVDGKQILLGSANMTGESLRHHGNLVVGIHSPNLAKTIASHAEKLKTSTKIIPTLPTAIVASDQEIELWLLPEHGEAKDKLISMIQSAKKTIRVAMFTWTHPDLTEAVIVAHKKGIKVDIVLDKEMSEGVSSVTYQRLLEENLPVGVSHCTSLLHHKMMWLDDDTLINGSANWTKAAFNKNDDCFLILHELTEKQKKVLHEMWDVVQNESVQPVMDN